jgi:DNA primase
MRVRVATMAPGEDPDTLVQKGGAAALEPVLRDAVDVLERKIQLLERRGWFQGVEHRRDALDRLLPTIRAASDPITRELYLGLVAERTGVSREVLEREAKVAPAAAPEPSGPVARLEARSPAEPVRRRPPPGTSAERALVALCLADADWLERARREVPATWIERPALRELYGALLEGAAPEQLAERLSPDGIAAWQKLRGSLELVSGDPDEAYVGAVRLLEARPLFREYSDTLKRSRAEADPVRKQALAAEAFRQRDDGQRRFPHEWARYMSFQKKSGQARPGGTDAG